MITIPIEISARHLHLSQSDLNSLFGDGYQLTPLKGLSQPGQFAAEEVVEIQTPESWGLPPHMDFTFGKTCDHNQIRVLGPVRDETQIELSWSDFIALGLDPHIALSGDLKASTGGVIIVGPTGELKLERGVIIAKRHIHCSPEKAEEFGLTDHQSVEVKVTDKKVEGHCALRAVTFHDVIVRINPQYDWQMHIDTDEANAAGIEKKGNGEIIV